MDGREDMEGGRKPGHDAGVARRNAAVVLGPLPKLRNRRRYEYGQDPGEDHDRRVAARALLLPATGQLQPGPQRRVPLNGRPGIRAPVFGWIRERART